MARLFAAASTDKIVVANGSPIDGLAPINISFWMQFTANPVGTTQVWQKAPGAFQIQTNGTTNFQFRATRWPTPGVWTIAVPSSGVWHHITIHYAYDVIATDPTIYLDGTSVTVTRNTAPVGTLGTDTSGMNIGNNAAGTAAFNGSLAELALWGGVGFSQLDDAYLALGVDARTRDPNDIVGYWPLNGASPELDGTVNGNNGTVTGTTVVSGPMAIGGVYAAQCGQTQPANELVQIVDY